MSFDFFNAAGNEQANGIQFTQQENTFLETKLPFLDPKKTGKIQKGSALSLLKFSGLSGSVLQKILTNSKIDNSKKTISYDQMKKIFRGVSLAQKKHEPSSVNIEANIPLKMPAFYDDDDEQQQEQQKKESIQKNRSSASFQNPHHPPPKPVQQQPQRKPSGADLFAQFGKNDSPPKRVQSYNQKTTQKPQSQAKINAPSSQVIKKKDSLSDAIQKYQLYWKSIPNLGTKIAGSQVKKISGSSVDKSALAKSWKICNISEKGYLTKGQYFIFLNLVQQCKKNNKIPEYLTSDMKQIIYKIDGIRLQKQIVPGRDSGVRVTAPVSRQKIQSSQNLEVTQPFRQINNSSSLSMQNSRLMNQSRAISQNMEQINNLKYSQLESSRAIQQTDAFLTAIDAKNTEMKKQIDQLKTSQHNLNGSLNRVFLKMRDVLLKQAATVNDMVQYLHQQNENNKIRVNTLDNYADSQHQRQEQVSSIYQKQRVQHQQGNKNQQVYVQSQAPNYGNRNNIPSYEENNDRHYTQPERQVSQNRSRNQSDHKQSLQYHPNYEDQRNSNQHQERNERYQESVKNGRGSGKQSYDNRDSGANQTQQRGDFYFDQPQRNSMADHQAYEQRNRQSNIEQRSDHNQASPHEPRLQPNPTKSQQQLQADQKIRLKQNHVIKMLNYLAPIKPEEAPIVIQRISSMNEEQLNNLYAQLYQKYLIKERQRKQQQLRQSQSNIQSQSATAQSEIKRSQQVSKVAGRRIQNDDFDTSNFNQKTNHNEADVDFFA